MPRHPDMFKVIEVLEYYDNTGESNLQIADKFNMDRKTVSSWKKKYNLTDLRQEFHYTKELGSKTTIITRNIPEEIKAEAEASLANVSTITLETSTLLKSWVLKIKNEVEEKNGDMKTVDMWKIDRLIRLFKDTSIFTIPNSVVLDEKESNEQWFLKLQEKMAERKQQALK